MAAQPSVKRAFSIWLPGAAAVIVGACSLSVRLGCTVLAVQVAAATTLDGLLFGAALAAVTRTRRAGWIYFWLAACMLCLWPLAAGWPPAAPWDVHPWPGAPAIMLGYFDALRPLAFLAAIPCTFIRLGFHAADPVLKAAAEPHDTTL